MSFLCALPLAGMLFSACAAPPPLAVGYVEGDFVLVAPVEMARIETLAARQGDRVTAGQPLAALQADDARHAVAEARAALAQAEAQLADLRQGRRPEEIAVLEATLRSAGAQAAEARRVAVAAGMAGVALLTLLTEPPIAAVYLILVLAGVGTHGTQILIIAAVANFYPHNLRGTALGWALAGAIIRALRPSAHRMMMVNRVSGGLMIGAAGLLATTRRA